MLTTILYGVVIILLGAILLILKKEGGTEEIVKDLFSSRTIFALIIYATFAYLAIKGSIQPDTISNALFALMAYYFGYKSGQQQTNGGEK